MKALLALLLVAGLIAGAWLLYPEFAKRGESSADAAPPPPWADSRSWSSGDGRALSGRLIAGMDGAGVFLREGDDKHFRIKPDALAPADAALLKTALGDARLARTVDGLYHLRRRLEIPGQQAITSSNAAVYLGPRIAKSDALYWLFLTELDGSSPQWVRIDGDAYRRFANDTLLARTELVNFVGAGGGFFEALPWPRPELLLVEAKYGLSARRIDVTRDMMGMISKGSFPQTVNPGMFGLPPHHPDVWDLVLTWVKRDGTYIYRTVRDEQIVTWP